MGGTKEMLIVGSKTKEALKEVADLLNISDKDITAKLHKKGFGGFLGIGSKEPSTYIISTIPDQTPVDAVIKASIIEVGSKMGYEISVEKIESREDEKTYVLLNSDSAGHIIGKRGKTLEALQFIVNLIVQQFSGIPPKILLDIENYRERRAKYLMEMAIRMAESVVKNGKSRLLDPLNPYERRLVHMELEEDDRIYTESEGIGVYKRVRIKLNKKNASNRKQEKNSDDQSGIPKNINQEKSSDDQSGIPKNKNQEKKFKDENDLDQSILTGSDEEVKDDPIPEELNLESTENQYNEN